MLNYNAPVDGVKSTIDESTNSEQMRTFFWLKKALIEARKEQYFMPLASAINMPKHYGKHIKCYEYIPLLDDRNVNDEGIDAEGAVIDSGSGNLYGSSRDIGTINKNLPTLSENGGRVNRVGFSRIQFEGTIQKFGFFYEFTQESLDFDSDDGLKEHLAREAMNGAVQLTEAVLQKDLLAAAGVVVYPGSATADNEVTGEGAEPTVLDYETLMRLDQILTENRTPMHTKVITGSRLVDTKVIPSARVLYCSADLVRHMKSMKDLFNNKAFVEVQHYADAGNILHGEVGSIDHFRIVQVPEMLHWAGAGAQVKDEGTKYKHTDGKYDVYPLLCLGDDSWSTIGFQTDGKSLKFNVMTKMPGRETADRMTDPYGETGFSSIKWYYGFLLKRPHRIGLIKCVAPI